MDKKNNKKLLIVLLICIIAIICIVCMVILFSKPSLEKLKDSVVMIEVYDEENELMATGSGFCAYKSNYIVTNFHVIEGAYKIKVISDEKKEYDVKNVLIFDNTNDLAILDAKLKLNPVKLGDTKKVKTGQNIYTIGSPLGELNTVAEGIISNSENDKGFQISAPISHGSSGGALFNKNGQLIGITYAGYDEAQNLNFAIDVKYLENMYNALVNKKYELVDTSDYLAYDSVYFNVDSKEELKIAVGTKKQWLDDIGGPAINKKVLYLATSDISEFYELTNKYQIFDRVAINNWSDYILNDYTSHYMTDHYRLMSKEKKKEVVDTFEALNEYETCEKTDGKSCDDNVNIDTISVWTNYQFALELDLLTRFDLAVFIVETENFNTYDEYFNYIENLKTDIPHKAMFTILFGGYLPSDLSNSNASAVVEYFASLNSFSQKDKELCLEYLGYRVEGDMAYW